MPSISTAFKYVNNKALIYHHLESWEPERLTFSRQIWVLSSCLTVLAFKKRKYWLDHEKCVLGIPVSWGTIRTFMRKLWPSILGKYWSSIQTTTLLSFPKVFLNTFRMSSVSIWYLSATAWITCKRKEQILVGFAFDLKHLTNENFDSGYFIFYIYLKISRFSSENMANLHFSQCLHIAKSVGPSKRTTQRLM